MSHLTIIKLNDNEICNLNLLHIKYLLKLVMEWRKWKLLRMMALYLSMDLLEVLSLTKDHHHQAVSERIH